MKQDEMLLFRNMADIWLKNREPDLKYSSNIRYKNLLQLYLLPAFGDMPVTEITREMVKELRINLLTKGGLQHTGLSPKTVSSILSVLKSILSYAERESECKIQDMRDISVRQMHKPLRVFSLHEQQSLSRYLCSHPSLPNIGILIALYTGMRLGEICALKWEDISTEEGCIHVRHSMQRVQTLQDYPRTQVIITRPKSDSSIRQIPIPDSLITILKKIQQKDDHFFLTGSPDKYMEPRTMENRFNRVLVDCGIEDASFHTCRHTFATRCIELGFDIKSLSEILGHASVNITMNRYVHPSLAFKRENMNKLSDMIMGNHSR